MFNRRLLVIAAAVAGLALAGCAKGKGPIAPSAEDMSLGDPKAKVEVIEYASVTCPHCARFNAETFPAFKAKYVDTGRVHYTFKEFITEPAPVAAAGYLLARCAGKDRYFAVLDQMFRSQDETTGGGDVRAALLRIAKGAGLSEAQVEQCFNDKAAQDALNARVQRHVEVDKITSTPTFIINGKRTEGVMTLPELDAAIAGAAKR